MWYDDVVLEVIVQFPASRADPVTHSGGQHFSGFMSRHVEVMIYPGVDAVCASGDLMLVITAFMKEHEVDVLVRG